MRRVVGGGPGEDGGAPELSAGGGVLVAQHLDGEVVLVSVSEGLGGALLQLCELVAWRCGQRVLGCDCGGLGVGESGKGRVIVEALVVVEVVVGGRLSLDGGEEDEERCGLLVEVVDGAGQVGEGGGQEGRGVEVPPVLGEHVA